MKRPEILESINLARHSLGLFPIVLKRETKAQLLETLNELLTKVVARSKPRSTPLLCTLNPSLAPDPAMPRLLYDRYHPSRRIKLDRVKAEKLHTMFSQVGFTDQDGLIYRGPKAATILTALWGQNPHKIDKKCGLYLKPAMITLARQKTYITKSVKVLNLKTNKTEDKIESIPIDLKENEPLFIRDETGSEIINFSAVKDIHFFNCWDHGSADVLERRSAFRDAMRRAAPNKRKVKKKPIKWGVSDPRHTLDYGQYIYTIARMNGYSYKIDCNLFDGILKIHRDKTGKDSERRSWNIGKVSLQKTPQGDLPLADLSVEKLGFLAVQTQGRITPDSVNNWLNQIYDQNKQDSITRSLLFDRSVRDHAAKKSLFTPTQWNTLKRSARLILFTLFDRGLISKELPIYYSIESYRKLSDDQKLSDKERQSFNSAIAFYASNNRNMLKHLWCSNDSLNKQGFPSLPLPKADK